MMNKLGGFMKIIVSDRLLEFSDKELDSMQIDYGQEGTVYRFEDEAYKIYHVMCLKTRLDEEIELHQNSQEHGNLFIIQILIPSNSKGLEKVLDFIHLL